MCCPCGYQVMPSCLQLCHHVATRSIEWVPLIFLQSAVALFLLCGLSGGGSLLDGMAKRAPGRASTQNKTLYTVNAHMIKHKTSSYQRFLKNLDEKWKTFCFCTGEEILRKRFANPGICWQKSCAYATAAVTRCLYEDTIWNNQNAIKAVSS